MILTTAHVWLFRNIVDSGSVPIDPSVTCLVGKNESGKTAFLEALYRLNPVYEEDARFDVVTEYPRWRTAQDRRQKEDLDATMPVEAWFDLEPGDRQAIRAVLDVPLATTTRVLAQRTYGGTLKIGLVHNTIDLIAAVVAAADLEPRDAEPAGAATDFESLGDWAKKVLSGLAQEERERRGKGLRRVQTLAKAAAPLLKTTPPDVRTVLIARLPKFFYFSEYSTLPGRLDLTALLAKERAQMVTWEKTAMALLELASVTGQEFQDQNFESRVSELEAAAAGITREVFEYWTQNRELLVSLVGDAEQQSTPTGQTVVHRYVDIRLNDTRHQMTTNLSTRSSGFRWFFSFIAAFSDFERRAERTVVLLDEPGLALHARAQQDFLRFINNRLAAKNQVLYTTHSPFMVEADKLERVRVVEDRTSRDNPDLGGKVESEALSTDADTLFPLQAALGYDLAQNLFVGGGTHLVVEGVADWIYLTELSQQLSGQGRTGLHDAFTIVPVGGIDKVPTFVALLGVHLDVSVLIDGKSHQKLNDLAQRGFLAAQRIVAVSQANAGRTSDIEDLFLPSDYLTLFNATFGTDYKVKDLPNGDRVVRRLEQLYGPFDHGRVATQLLKGKPGSLDRVSAGSLDRFEELFRLMNATLAIPHPSGT